MHPSPKLENQTSSRPSRLGSVAHLLCIASAVGFLFYSLDMAMVAREEHYSPFWIVLPSLLSMVNLVYFVVALRLWKAHRGLLPDRWPWGLQLLVLMLVWCINVAVNMSFIAV